MKKSLIYITMLAGSILAGAGLTSCVDDGLVKDMAQADGIYQIDEDEYALGVNISLNKIGGTRAALSDIGDGGLADIEEYVDTEHLYVLFFNLEGYYLFSIQNPTAIPIGQSALGNDSQWFIKIPVKTINENLIKYIEENPFKIAVLANWTFDSDINKGDGASSGISFEFKEPLDSEGNLTLDDFGNLKSDSHISMLSHAQIDKAYTDDNEEENGYGHLVYWTETGPHMGPYTEWVANYHRNIPMADEHIRSYFNVSKNIYENPGNPTLADQPEDSFYKEPSLSHFQTKYNNIWHVWYFGGTGNYDDKAHYVFGDTKKDDWKQINQVAKEKMMKNEPGENFGYIGSHSWELSGYEPLFLAKGIVPNYMETGAAVATDESGTAKLDFNGFIIGGEIINKADNDAGNPLNLSNDGQHPYISFKANADGYVRINYTKTPGTLLYAHVGLNNTPQNNASGYQKSNQDNRYMVDEDGYLVKKEGGEKQIADIPFEAKDVYIYMVKDPNYQPEVAEGEEVPKVYPCATIYGIEYIESRHLYDVDRHGILPTKDYPIPMYGIQDFDAIGEYWEPGILFNLSQFNNAKKTDYNYRRVSLLRSLARVEVKLSKKAFVKKPAHVYLRSLNRSARIMPVDFITPTDIIWNGFNSSSPTDVKRLQNYINTGNLREQEVMQNTHGVQGEWDNIMQYGPIYIGSNKNSGESKEQKMKEYRKTTAWPFGIWEYQWGWNWNREARANDANYKSVGEFDTYKVGDTRKYTGQAVPEYPRILHPRISRSDYAHFTEVEDPDYWHYIIYVPEKNITDADNPGNIADRPKICHVEIRFNGGMPELENDEDNLVDNFDDNGAYRLYFTTGGRASLGNFNFTGRESWDSYEYDWDIAKQHWPIMRNHEYIFTVTGAPSHSGNINLQVNAPDQRNVYWDFY